MDYITSGDAQGLKHRWVSVSLVDGLIYEGQVMGHASYGLYVIISGDNNRLNLFPWHTINKVFYKPVN